VAAHPRRNQPLADPSRRAGACYHRHPYQIEAGFHFKINGDYFGGYLRSVALTHHEAESNTTGNPTVNIRYNPANPDQTAVLAEDNPGNLTFRIVSG
jgi:hypothetical protein